jgi:hypothetical protein
MGTGGQSAPANPSQALRRCELFARAEQGCLQTAVMPMLADQRCALVPEMLGQQLK